MSGLLPESLLVHVATPVSFEEPAGAWIEGEPGVSGGGTPTAGVPFGCVLFMPSAGGEVQNPYRQRTVREPTLLYNPTRDDETEVVIGAENELLIDAPEFAALTDGSPARWLVVGAPQPFGPPGILGGYQATLRRVED